MVLMGEVIKASPSNRSEYRAQRSMNTWRIDQIITESAEFHLYASIIERLIMKGKSRNTVFNLFLSQQIKKI